MSKISYDLPDMAWIDWDTRQEKARIVADPAHWSIADIKVAIKAFKQMIKQMEKRNVSTDNQLHD